MQDQENKDTVSNSPKSDEKSWPLDARAAIFALEVSGNEDVWKNRRRLPRHMCRVEGTVVSGTDPTALADAIVYLRDVNDRFVGFVSSSPLRKNEIYWLHCDRVGVVIHAQVRVIRCNSFMEDWHDCAAVFLEPQNQFGPMAA
jgi:hypothetical protein